MGLPVAARKSPTLTQTDDWFNDTILPKRTASAGFSGNRIWKSPRDLVKGNTEDPDGLCGDAADFMYEQFWRDFNSYETGDGFHMGLVLWKGTLVNHMANVMLVRTKIFVQEYSWDSKKRAISLTSGKAQYNTTEFFTLHVYDLYYKKKATTLEMWWKARDASLSGTVKVGFPHNIDD
jgi:hypothetical protein